MKTVRYLFCHKSVEDEHELVNYILDRGKKASSEVIDAIVETGKLSLDELTDFDVKVLETKRFVGVIFEKEEFIFKKILKSK
jgi:hypothetical protein